MTPLGVAGPHLDALDEGRDNLAPGRIARLDSVEKLITLPTCVLIPRTHSGQCRERPAPTATQEKR